ncbi:hypothetical protein COY87_01430 [Candidatus Roizmanbacteria bacterium CG_4_10_14_0_8_um_filter_33_9]|uniref:Cytidylate kinase-like family protein n=1 Tax=Candidatus Roizmanbacteria bacterium CG_4_10_14_0_8_um_filter_33_9 TaxID=1974826 RepID=A0A2M7QK98_9BACT|nr:MAG: hypothetical protein COY87_01430 [Candidatus Roizmanbacteria bacterium CG_4_10_14_0_8_um_filter_33_9]
MKRFCNLINKNFELFSRHLHYFGKKTHLMYNHLPIITISRQMGSGGKPIADLVAFKLGSPWKVYHKDILDQIAQDARLEKQIVEDTDEMQKSVMSEIVFDALGKKYMSLPSYYKHLLQILSIIGKRGNAIIIGRGSNFLFPNALKIRIICEYKQRIEWTMKYDKLTRNEALKRIKESDLTRSNYTKTLFKHDNQKPHHFDLVIQTGPNLGIKEASDLIVYLAKKRFGL